MSTIKNFGFRDQIQRASVSIMTNIAEGFCRQTKKEKINFLNFAKGSAGEVKNMYFVAEDLNYLSTDTCVEKGFSSGINEWYIRFY